MHSVLENPSLIGALEKLFGSLGMSLPETYMEPIIATEEVLIKMKGSISNVFAPLCILLLLAVVAWAIYDAIRERKEAVKAY